MHPAISLAPETGPKPLITPESFVGSMVCKRWVTANMAPGVKHPAARQKGDQTDSRRPPIAQRPTDKTGKEE
jgi:hypothetical protein